MKRALAERAKQSLPHPDTSASAAPEVPPPSKAPRREAPPSPESSIKSSNARNKRIKSLTKVVSSEEQDNASAFYLRHQNRALATELQSLQFAVGQLEEERDYRRKHCLAACQALNSLQATWTQLETALGSSNGPGAAASTAVSVAAHAPQAPPSTGPAVEWTRALAESLAALSQQQQASSAATLEQFYVDLSRLSANVSNRANSLQECLWKVVTKQQESTGAVPLEVLSAAEWEQRLQTATAEQRRQAIQIAELERSRGETAGRERKIRRNLYRMAAGMLTANQVVKELDNVDDDEDAAHVKLEAAAMTQKQEKEQQQQQQQSQDQPVKQEASANGDNSSGGTVGGLAVSSAQVEQYEARVAELTQLLSSRDKSIQEMGEQIKGRDLEINKLARTQQSESDVQKLQSLEATKLELERKRKEFTQQQRMLTELKEKWATALGNEKAALSSAEERSKKFQKRWVEFTRMFDMEEEENGSSDVSPTEQSLLKQAERITELQHKLDHALESVRQAESSKTALTEALAMNEGLQQTLSEAKNETEPCKTEASEDNGEANGDAKKQRDLKRLEAAKAKVERLDREREELRNTNARLLKQSAEKDEMNAKSLSTILHLKGLTDKLTLEKELLEQQAKNASQLALAARLTSNAKDRVTESVEKENKELLERIKSLEKERGEAKSEIERLTQEWSTGSGALAGLKAELSNLSQRNDTLVAENETKASEIRSFVDSLVKAEREAKEAKERLDQILKNSGGQEAGTSNFSMNQLNTQITVLKGRLACPVCHYRDKECIIMRCRHMHCKQCVEERITNRSRKCPTCNVKFSEKDVEDVWLS